MERSFLKNFPVKYNRSKENGLVFWSVCVCLCVSEVCLFKWSCWAVCVWSEYLAEQFVFGVNILLSRLFLILLNSYLKWIPFSFASVFEDTHLAQQLFSCLKWTCCCLFPCDVNILLRILFISFGREHLAKNVTISVTYEKNFQMCIYYDSLVILRWPCVVDRMSKSSHWPNDWKIYPQAMHCFSLWSVHYTVLFVSDLLAKMTCQYLFILKKRPCLQGQNLCHKQTKEDLTWVWGEDVYTGGRVLVTW